MSIGLLLPAGLFALTALLLPILLHLARRDLQQPLTFAAMRWLAGKVQPRNRLRFDDVPLLLLRLLLLALAASWLAQPVLRDAPARRSQVVVIPGISPATVAAQALPKTANIRWLAPGFPALTSAASTTVQPISSLLRQLDSQLPPGDPLIVLAPPQFDGADAQPPVLSRPVDWRIVQGHAPAAGAATATPALPLDVHSDAAHRAQARYLLAVAQAWASAGTRVSRHAAVADALPRDHKTTVAWLADGAPPNILLDWAATGGTLLLSKDTALPNGSTVLPLWRDATGDVLLQGAAHGRGRLLRFTRPLTPAAMPVLLEGEFPQRLGAALQAPAAAASRTDARFYRLQTGAVAPPQTPRTLQPWLALLIALVFLCERWRAAGQREALP